MKTIFCVGVVTIIVLVGNAAGAGAPELTEAVNQLQTRLQAIPALTSNSSGTCLIAPLYYEINHSTPEKVPSHTIDVIMTLKDNMYHLSRKDTTKRGDVLSDLELAFDGKSAQRFTHGDGALEMWSKGDTDIFSSYPAWTPLQQFAFLTGLLPGRSRDNVSLTDLKSVALWAKLLQNADYLGHRKVGDQDCISFQILNAAGPRANVPCRYEVDLSIQHGYFPIRWASYMLKEGTYNGALHRDFTVTEFGKASFDGKDYYYPKQAAGRDLCLRVADRGQVLFTVELKTSAFNLKPVDAERFTIDPAKASQIVDVDANVAIRIPLR